MKICNKFQLRLIPIVANSLHSSVAQKPKVYFRASSQSCRQGRVAGLCRSASNSKLSGSRKLLPEHHASPPSDVFVLDFDGVLCDSQDEVSTSAYRTAESFWPESFANAGEEAQRAVMAGLKKTRPVLVDGFESAVMARMLLEDPSSVGQILENWDHVWPSKLKEWGADAQLLKGYYEGFRTGMFIKNKEEWIAGNRLYPGIQEGLRGCEFPFYVVSVKSAKRLSILLTALLGTTDFPPCSPRLFGSLVPPSQKKVDALRKIMARPIVAKGGARVHFVDDRLDTLKAVKGAPGMENVKLYFAAWGYSTASDLEEAKAASWLKFIKLPQFVELLNWGILMGVDDGCEPTEEEVISSVHAKKISE